MRNRIQLTLLAFFLISNLSFGQEDATENLGTNLVPNPSFESLRNKSPDLSIDAYLAYRNYLSRWASPTKTTPDLLFNVNDDQSPMARTGEKMLGILTHNPISKRSDTWREYAQVKLTQTLQEGEEYELEFWVKRHPQANMASNNMGAFLGYKPIILKNYDPINELELVVNETNIINPDEPKWVKISGRFIAKGKEHFLVIGNFHNNENTKFKDVKNLVEPAWENPYYLLDDVSLKQIIKTEPVVVAEPEPVFEDMEIKKGQVIRLDKIYFDFDKSDLLPASNEQLDKLVELLNAYPSMRIAIHGHTDSRGSDTYNEKLSDSRAQAVFNYVGRHAVSPNRLTYKGFGEVSPVDTNETDEGRQNNRRVEFVVLELNDENVEIENSAASPSY